MDLENAENLTFGELIKAFRRRAQLTQVQFAERLEKNRQGKRSVGEAWENEGESAVKVRQGESHETLPELCKRHEALVSTN